MSYPTKEKPQMSENVFFGSNVLNILQQFSLTTPYNLLFQRLEKIHLSFFLWREAFLYLRCTKWARLKGNWSSFVGKCIQNGGEVLLFWQMTLLKNFLDVSISSPSKNSTQLTQTTGVCENALKILAKKTPKKFHLLHINNFLNHGAFYSGGEVLCIPLAAKQKGPTDFINTLREWVRDKTHLEA